MTKKAYILAPNCDYAPDRDIVLGLIWTDPLDPGSCINASKVTAFPDNKEPNYTYKTDWKHEKTRERGGLVGIWAKFLQFLGLDAEASFKWSNSDGSVYKFDKLDTFSFEPTPAYVKTSVTGNDVEEFIKAPENNYQVPVYMVTGLKIARGAESAITHARELGVDARLGIDGTSAGTPAAGGPKLTLEAKDTNDVSFKDSSDFVFAYRVREIYYEKGSLKTKPYNKGELADKSGPSVSRDTKIEYTLKVSGLMSEDIDASMVGQKGSGCLDDDDEECEVVLPQAKHI